MEITLFSCLQAADMAATGIKPKHEEFKEKFGGGPF